MNLRDSPVIKEKSFEERYHEEFLKINKLAEPIFNTVTNPIGTLIPIFKEIDNFYKKKHVNLTMSEIYIIYSIFKNIDKTSIVSFKQYIELSDESVKILESIL